MQPLSSSPDANALPGTAAYLPELIARARTAHPDLPIDPIILQSLLICLIAQPRSPGGNIKAELRTGSHVGLHLILRTKEEDVGVVVNLVALTLQHMLGISTHKHKIAAKVQHHKSHRSRAKSTAPSSSSSAQVERPDAFLRSLFFRRIVHTSISSHRSSTPRLRPGVGGDSTPRLGNIHLGLHTKNSRSTGTSSTPQRSSSFPIPTMDGEEEDQFFDASSLASSRRPLLAGRTPASTMRSNASRGRPGAHRLRTDPLPLSSLFSPDAVETEDLAPPTTPPPDSIHPQKSVPSSERTNESSGAITALPKAVVVSGLEHTSTPSQRALARVLTERRVVFDGNENDNTDMSEREPEVEDGTWNLPHGFLMVYVCKWDLHERPAILRGLIDKFSMSADVPLASSIRQSYLAYRAVHSPTPRGTPVASPLVLPHTSHPFFAAPTPVHPSPGRRVAPLPVPTPQMPPVLSTSELAELRTFARPYPTAAPIFYPSVHATVQNPTIHSLPPHPPPHAALHPSLDMYLLDLFSATRHHPALDGTLLTMRAHADAEALARAFRMLHGDTVGAALVFHEARMGDRETAAAPESFDGGSWTERSPSGGWKSAESVVGNGYGPAKGKGSDDFVFGSEHEGRLKVDAGEGESRRSVSGPYDALLGEAVRMTPEPSAAEALQLAMERAWPEVWDVSEEDVARIFPRVVSHRLRVRDGPDDELLGSVMWPAVSSDTGAAGGQESVEGNEGGVRIGWERKSVKEILVRILADV